MKTLGIACLSILLCASGLSAQASSLTTPEAQSIVEAADQSWKHVLSLQLLAQMQLVVALVALSLVFNARSLAMVFLIIYGALSLNTPYYIPTFAQTVFGWGAILLAALGLALRALSALRGPKTPPKA